MKSAHIIVGFYLQLPLVKEGFVVIIEMPKVGGL
jgi:hypothetical protein